MKPVSLSTMRSVNYDTMAEFVSEALAFGFTHFELNSSLSPERLDEILQVEGLQVSSIHAPCPNPANGEGTFANALSLSSLNEDDRREAVSHAKATVDLASRVGAKAVVLHAGWAEISPDLEMELRRLWQQGLAESDQFADTKAKLVAARAFFACPHVDAAKESLLELAAYARPQGVMLALENRVHYHEIPGIDEMLDILCEFSPEAVGYWHDVGHAELLSRIGFIPHEDWFMAVGDRLLGVHLHDVRGVQDHYAPGAGEIDWDFIARNLPEDAIRVCEIAEWNDPQDARAAPPFLHSKGIV